MFETALDVDSMLYDYIMDFDDYVIEIKIGVN